MMVEIQTLKNCCQLLISMEESELQKLADSSVVSSIAAGQYLLNAGKEIEYVYVVLEGSLASLFTRDWGEKRILNEIPPGGLVGEVELINGDNCQLDIIALEKTKILEIPQDIFSQLLEQNEAFWEYASERARSQIWRVLIAQFLNNLFGTSKSNISDPLIRLQADNDWLDFELEILQSIEKNIHWVTLSRGEVLFRQGEDADGAYVLVSGTMNVSVLDDNEAGKEIAFIRQGEIVGELALITDDKRSATITALRDSELFRIDADIFERVSERYPRIMLGIYQTISKRLRAHIPGGPSYTDSSNIALVAANPEIQLHGVANRLFESVKQYRNAILLSNDLTEQYLKRPGITRSRPGEPGNTRLVQWLNNQETKYDHILYQADNNWSTWTKRCIRQADHVIIVADPKSRNVSYDLIEQLNDSRQQWSLLFVHPAGIDRPRNTAQWIANSLPEEKLSEDSSHRRKTDSNPKFIHHLRQGNQQDYQRIARILSGCATGLVLGGGGARGFAHLGVLRALEELNVTIDMIGGTSIGAPISGWVAQQMNAKQTRDAATNAFQSLIDLTFPSTSVIAGKRIADVITEQTGSWDIEDFWLPFFCISTNITTAQSVVHTRGNSARAIRASVSIPGVLPPVPEKGELLVDGGVLNNMPIDVMRYINPAGTVLAIDVGTSKGMNVEEDYGLSVSGWRELLSRFIPTWVKPVYAPKLAEVLMQSMVVGSAITRDKSLRSGLADFYCNIQLPDVGLLDFNAVSEVEKRGYDTVIGPLKEWLNKQSSVGD
jgi:predicted acylesterase/phospholipase RssA/CRP-like cAMP-binding protein